MRHEPDALMVAPGTWRPVCSCGWKTTEWLPKKKSALKVATNHATRIGCGKRRFTREAAEAAVLKAKIARGLRNNPRRLEERAYPCPICSGEVWHLTSRPLRVSP